MGLEFHERISRVRKHVPPEDEAHWMLALLVALGIAVYAVWVKGGQ